jgi:hypothetical protein
MYTLFVYCFRDQVAESIDILFRVRPVITALLSTFALRAVPSGKQSVDEAMIAGKVKKAILIHHVHNKPTPDGFKVWCLSCSHTGYVHGFIVCAGEETGYYVEVRSSVRQGEAVVLKLTENTKEVRRTL